MLRVFLLLVFLVAAGVGGVIVTSGDLPAQQQPDCEPRCG
jgi:hypothetical protein